MNYMVKYRDDLGGQFVWAYGDPRDAENLIAWREECDRREGYYVENAYEIKEVTVEELQKIKYGW